MHCYYLKIDDDALFKNRSKRPTFVLRPLNVMLNFEVDRISLQQLEYEINRTDYPVNFIFFIGYCSKNNFPYANNQFNRTTKFNNFPFSGRRPSNNP